MLVLGFAAAALLRRRFDRLRLAVTFDGDVAALAVGHHVDACRTGGRRVLRVLVVARAVKAATQRLLLFAVGRTPGMADRLALPLAVTFFLALRRGRGGRNERRKIRAGLRDDPRTELFP